MTNSANYNLALRFANMDAQTRAGARIAASLGKEVNAALWANDAAGDLYVVALNLLASIGIMRNPAAYAALIEAFPEWWKLDGAAAKTIAQEIDRAVESETLHELKKSLSLVATWLTEDETPFNAQNQPISWEDLRTGALEWKNKDAEWMRGHPAQWESELPAASYSYYDVTPILSTTQLLAASDATSKALRSKELQEKCMAGEIRIFAVAEVLKKLRGPIAAVLIEKTAEGWRPGRVYMKDEAVVPQSMHRLTRQIALQYQSRAAVNDNDKRIALVRSRMDAGSLVGLMLKDVATARHDQNELPRAAWQSNDNVPEKDQVILLDTCTLLEAAEREAVGDLIRGFAGTVVIVGAVIDELERMKATRPDLIRDANAALRCIEQWLSDGKANIEGIGVERQRPYADREILESIERYVKAGVTVTLITADTALRVRARASHPKGRLVTIDSRAMRPEKAFREPQPGPEAGAARDVASLADRALVNSASARPKSFSRVGGEERAAT